MSFLSIFGSKQADDSAIVDAINASQAVIELGLDGTILHFNENFRKTMGYDLDEVKGKHHSLFVDPAYAKSAEYREFWEKLARGEFAQAKYKRLAKGGKIVWLDAMYKTVFDSRGKPLKVIKFARDISDASIKMADLQGQLEAIGKSQAVIEFNLDGTIITANENFLKTMGYVLADIKDRHHSLFVEPAQAQQAEYQQFWDRLKRGEYVSGQFERRAKDGREVWIQASYNPILDLEGRPYKVVKFATDITEQVKASRIEKVVREILQAVDAAKDKDLTQRVSTDEGMTDVKSLSSGVNELLETLGRLIDFVRDASQESVSAATSITQGSRDLATRTEQQAASLEETAATTEQLAASVKNTAQASRQAAIHAEEARSVAEEGGQTVGQAVEAMTRIEQASTRISEITTVIEEIAFQTNLLALNAAVEAARAGDAGKGFAVVAAEVRTLAQRSSQAAKDIGGLISSSTAEVSQGVRLVRLAGTTLDKIVHAAARVAGTVTEISSAAGEQAHGIDEMSQAIAHMDQMTQQNAALSEESSAAAAALYDKLQALNGDVAQFQTARSRTGFDVSPAAPMSEAANRRPRAAETFKERGPAGQASRPAGRAGRNAASGSTSKLRAATSGSTWGEF
jgi:methyl-accepting chemotaxis protein